MRFAATVLRSARNSFAGEACTMLPASLRRLGARGRGVAWYAHARSSGGDETWKAYGHTRVVLEAGRRIEATPLRLHAFGGPSLLFIDNVSNDAVAVGGVGGFGFEFFMPRDGKDGPVSYRIEVGGIGTTARANGQAGAASFANGFLVGAAMHFYP